MFTLFQHSKSGHRVCKLCSKIIEVDEKYQVNGNDNFFHLRCDSRCNVCRSPLTPGKIAIDDFQNCYHQECFNRHILTCHFCGKKYIQGFVKYPFCRSCSAWSIIFSGYGTTYDHDLYCSDNECIILLVLCLDLGLLIF